MIQRRITRSVVALLLLSLLGAGGVYGRISFRWGGSSVDAMLMDRLRGTLVYEAPVHVNGGRGQLRAISYEGGVGELMKSVLAAFPDAEVTLANGALGMVVLREEGHVRRLTLLEPVQGRAMLFDLDQTEAQSRRSGETPATAATALAAYPGSRIAFAARNEETGTGLTLAGCSDTPAGVLDYYDRTLSADGWTSVRQPRSALSGSGMRVYARDAEVCCVLASADITGETRIALLHKSKEFQ